MRCKPEAALHHHLASCPKLAAAGGCVVSGHTYGVVLNLGAHPLGVWSFRDEHFVFRALANYEPTHAAANVAQAHRYSLALVEDCRQGWAERQGGPAPLPVAA